MTPLTASVYVHVPFCRSKCDYCDFASEAGRPASDHAAFADAVLSAVSRHGFAGRLDRVPTLYIGGGTPTLLGSGLPELVRRLSEALPLEPDGEITVEANPESLSPDLARALASAGVSRLSLGVQSFDDAVLAELGRCHTADDARSAAASVRDAGMALAVDLMCGIPVQNEASWMTTVLAAVTTGAEHVSVYPLTVEDGTPLAARVARDDAAPPDADRAADDMVAAGELLESAGLVRYETANYARPGFESRHNLGYWTGRAYVGVGPSAASMLPWEAYDSTGFERVTGQAGGRVRFVAVPDLDRFLAGPSASPAELEYLTPREAAREDAMLGLRLRDGIVEEVAERAGVVETLRDLAAVGLVEHAEPSDTETATREPGRWRLTDRGWLLGNEVFSRVWNAE